jgi:hypothetical protein
MHASTKRRPSAARPTPAATCGPQRVPDPRAPPPTTPLAPLLIPKKGKNRLKRKKEGRKKEGRKEGRKEERMNEGMKE